mmetsp:Transcript_57657/g.137195  ORF Transcript_57657/g.137195 Transcript_57657/m.137195 type:complete len:207 (-) Transcript_57657:404-1024(-)
MHPARDRHGAVEKDVFGISFPSTVIDETSAHSGGPSARGQEMHSVSAVVERAGQGRKRVRSADWRVRCTPLPISVHVIVPSASSEQDSLVTVCSWPSGTSGTEDDPGVARTRSVSGGNPVKVIDVSPGALSLKLATSETVSMFGAAAAVVVSVTILVVNSAEFGDVNPKTCPERRLHGACTFLSVTVNSILPLSGSRTHRWGPRTC